MSRMIRLREAVKNVAALLLFHTGVLKVLISLRFRRSAAILMYHRVLPDDGSIDSFSSDAIIVTPEQFDWQIALLHRHMRPRSLSTIAESVACKDDRALSRTCAITFDDGWFDNHAYAWPILGQRRTPATIFLSVSHIGTGECFWQERLARLINALWQSPSLRERAIVMFPTLGSADTAAHDLSNRIREAITRLKDQPSSEIATALKTTIELCNDAGIDADGTEDDRFMDWQQVQELCATGYIDMGSHAKSHTPLTRLTPSERMRELVESRYEISAQTKLGCEMSLAYPNGNFDDATVADARTAGYQLAVTTLDGTYGVADDPYRVRRISIHKRAAPTPARFLCRLAGLL